MGVWGGPPENEEKREEEWKERESDVVVLDSFYTLQPYNGGFVFVVYVVPTFA
jgi:hypothetical protein